MKQNTIKRPSRINAIVVLTICIVAAAAVGVTLGYEKLRSIWIEQCAVRDMRSQVSISAGRMVSAEIVAESFGLRVGANLALIDFDEKRRETLSRIPNIRAISVTRHLPARVEIVVEERIPVARMEILHQNRRHTGRVVDSEGMVFMCQRGTSTLPAIREAAAPGTPPGKRLSPRVLAALRLVERCQEREFQELGLLEIDVSRKDYLLATLGSYSRLKIAWRGMEDDTPESDARLRRQLSRLLQAMRSHMADGAAIWNATDESDDPRIYADTQGRIQ